VPVDGVVGRGTDSAPLSYLAQGHTRILKKFLIPVAAAAIMTGTAYAQTEFYVVQDTSTRKCIVD
jgi:hypothetical protein